MPKNDSNYAEFTSVEYKSGTFFVLFKKILLSNALIIKCD